MIINNKKRALDHLAYSYYLKRKKCGNKDYRNSKKNWKLAEALLIKLERRYLV